MNCWLWIILLCSAFGNGGCKKGCGCMDGRGRRGGNGHGHADGRGRDCDNGSPCMAPFASPVSSNGGCGCDDDMMTSRGFAGFGDGGTCGCEEKGEKPC